MIIINIAIVTTHTYPDPHLLSGSVTQGWQRSSSISFALLKSGSLPQKHCVPKLMPPYA